METKLSIAVSQTGEDSFNLVINKTTTTEGENPQTENVIKAGITLAQVKELINKL
jgi:hypothetical protein